MPDPINFDDKFESLFLTEILTYLSLKNDLQKSARRVSKSWKKICESYKLEWIKALNKRDSRVMLLELNSEKGKTMNNNIVQITGKRDKKSHRYPIRFNNWLTGENETLTIKICNLFPFTFTSIDNDKGKDDKNEPNLLEYSKTSLLRVSHGMLLDEVLTLARFEQNSIIGLPFEGSYQEFAHMPRSHPLLSRLNADMWTYWLIDPKLTAFTRTHGTILDVVSCEFLRRGPEAYGSFYAQQDKPWAQDGPRGRYLGQNMLRFMRLWAHERVTGTFWVTKKYKTGSIMVACTSPEEYESPEDITNFGEVYLVKGHNSVIAELTGPLPFKCRATLLPIYDLWTYDGCITVDNRVRLTPSQKKKLDDHVKTKIIRKEVSWRSPIAATWKYPPPPAPVVRHMDDHGVELNWEEHDKYDGNNIETPHLSSSDSSEKITEEHLELGRKFVKSVQENGGIYLDDNPTSYSWTVRRLGYSYKENPEGKALIMNNGEIFGFVSFEVDHEQGKNNRKYIPTYNLKELLTGLIATSMLKCTIGKMINLDEYSLVSSLQQVLTNCFEEENMELPTVYWYPPASEEESQFATEFGDVR